MGRKLCKDCTTYQAYGFSSVCKYCESDGYCPECGALMEMGKTKADIQREVFWKCPNGHNFDLYGKRVLALGEQE